MRIILSIGFVFLSLLSNDQSFYKYSDTVNHFSINIPSGWKTGINKNFPSIKSIVYRQPTAKTDTIGNNFNLNIFQSTAGSLEKAFTITLESLIESKNFQLIDSGNVFINGKNFKWLIERHENQHLLPFQGISTFLKNSFIKLLLA